MNRIFKKVYDKPALPFLEIFVWIYFFYLALRFFTFDPEPYAILSPEYWAPPGLIGFFKISGFDLWQFQLARTIGVITALLAAAGFFYRSSALVCLTCWAVVEVGINGFGFINVEIHLLWIGLALSICPLDRTERGKHFFSDQGSWAVVFIQLVLVLVYVQAGFAKLYVSGWAWVAEGSTFQIALVRQGISLGLALSHFALLSKSLAFVSIVLELSFLLYPFIEATRVPLLICSLIFHFGTEMLLGISFHHLWITSISLLLFGKDLLAPKVIGESRVILILDGSCVLCNRFARFLFASLWRKTFKITSFGSKTALDAGVDILNPLDADAMIWTAGKCDITASNLSTKKGVDAFLEVLKGCGPIGLFLRVVCWFLPKDLLSDIYLFIGNRRQTLELNGANLDACDISSKTRLSEFC